MTWQRYDTAQSHLISSTDVPGLRLHIRSQNSDPQRPAVLFVHGATYASRLYDIPHPGASWLAATAEGGFAAYGLDVRGYGRSHAPMLGADNRPFGRASEVIRDISDAVDWILNRHGAAKLDLVGGSWGSITAALFASTEGASRVRRLVLYAPIFAEPNDGWRQLLSDPKLHDRFNPQFGAYRLVTEAATRARWDAEMPCGADWREEDVFQALVRSSMFDDPQAERRDPPAFRAPNGTFLDLWDAFNGRALYQPQHITCPTLLLRGGADPTSTRSDALRLFDALGAENRNYVEIANGAHFVSAERKAKSVFYSATSFLRTSLP
ncbi:alpha/beta fold hydrolase [Thalassococcus sp. S3]|uniref:alpha/beta fold hydrolase n=1 Tax=Thalassococcus sp. S3 TaxID=2017482 RepID=UPI0010246E8E|nr:alpha/beta hydrolase [Thalassococcus sp. S3]QBF33685.1 hypothetical protein CFI11_21060 [Thalassococcus sp. S3]